MKSELLGVLQTGIYTLLLMGKRSEAAELLTLMGFKYHERDVEERIEAYGRVVDGLWKAVSPDAQTLYIRLYCFFSAADGTIDAAGFSAQMPNPETIMDFERTCECSRR